MNYSNTEKLLLRKLATEYMEIATLPIQLQKVEHIKKFNRLESVPPLVTAFQLPWNEINHDGSLSCVCNNRYLYDIELFFRKRIYKFKHFPLDMVVEPYLTIPFVAHNSSYGMTKVENIAITDKENDVTSHDYINQILEDEDIDKIKDMDITIDEIASAQLKSVVFDIMGDIIPIYQAGGVYIRCQMWDHLSEVMGVESIYFDLIDRPEFIHAIMERMTQSVLSGIEQANKLKLFNSSLNFCHCSPTYTDDMLPTFMGGKEFTSQNSWSFGMAQLFTAVSPEISQEFEIPYMSKIAKEFGGFYYGCCERLDDRLDLVATIPNVKKVSCSPWSNKKNFAEKLDPRLIMSQKPNPAFLAASSFNEDIVRADIAETIEIAKSNNLNVEFLLKDVSTVNYDPKRLDRWAAIVNETIYKYY